MKQFFLILPGVIPQFFITESLEVPEHFKQVDQIFWVVSDLDNIKYHWEKLSFNQVIDLDTVEVFIKTTGNKDKIRLAKANLGGTIINWIQPLEGNSIFSEFHSEKKDGAMSIIHRLTNEKDLDSVLEDYKSRGYVVSMSGTWGEKGKPGSGRYEYIDLEHDGGVTLELLWSYHE